MSLEGPVPIPAPSPTAQGGPSLHTPPLMFLLHSPKSFVPQEDSKLSVIYTHLSALRYFQQGWGQEGGEGKQSHQGFRAGSSGVLALTPALRESGFPLGAVD